MPNDQPIDYAALISELRERVDLYLEPTDYTPELMRRAADALEALLPPSGWRQAATSAWTRADGSVELWVYNVHARWIWGAYDDKNSALAGAHDIETAPAAMRAADTWYTNNQKGK